MNMQYGEHVDCGSFCFKLVQSLRNLSQKCTRKVMNKYSLNISQHICVERVMSNR